mmetsp:Transcript_56901/g.83281  ORF Transcript_56901/g.83281 Transcript_56901/m.83281 type:complete len:131 (+) Transcript_56901:168-560(+)
MDIYSEQSTNIALLLDQRRTGRVDAKRGIFKQQLHPHRFMLNHFTRLATLDSHQGCVNCISWSENGQKLVSGSDDTNICIWDYNQHRLLKSFDSGHSRNIFGVRFLPESGERMIASGAMDCEVCTVATRK